MEIDINSNVVDNINYRLHSCPEIYWNFCGIQNTYILYTDYYNQHYLSTGNFNMWSLCLCVIYLGEGTTTILLHHLSLSGWCNMNNVKVYNI